MSEQPTNTKKRDLPGDAAIPPSAPAAREDRTQQGWPGDADSPFVDKSYYDQFPRRCQPVFLPGSPGVINLTVEQHERMRARYQKGFALKTYVNMAMSPHILVLPGPTVDGPVHVKVPAFGVIRADPALVERIMIGDGFDYPQFFAIGAEGDCGMRDSFTTKDGQRIQTCRFYNCPRHPTGGQVVHTIHQAMHYVGSIGQGARDPRDPRYARSFIDEDVARKLLYKYNSFDPRPEVLGFAQLRMRALAERAARNDAIRNSGSPPRQ